MPALNDYAFIDAANKAAELRRASEARQWELMKLAFDTQLMPIGASSSPGMPHVELFPIAPRPR